MAELTILVIALLAAAIYSTILWRRRRDELWPWTSGVLATLISVLLGVAVALALFKYTNAQADASSRQRFRHLLRAEMSDTFRILSSEETMSISMRGTTQTVHIAYIQPLSIEQAAQSGLFDEVQTENLLLLARTMRMYNLKVQYLLGGVAAGTSSEAVHHASVNVESTREAVLADIRLMMKKLDMELSPSIHAQ